MNFYFIFNIVMGILIFKLLELLVMMALKATLETFALGLKEKNKKLREELEKLQEEKANED